MIILSWTPTQQFFFSFGESKINQEKAYTRIDWKLIFEIRITLTWQLNIFKQPSLLLWLFLFFSYGCSTLLISKRVTVGLIPYKKSIYLTIDQTHLSATKRIVFMSLPRRGKRLWRLSAWYKITLVQNILSRTYGQPWLASLIDDARSRICSGALIDENWVLTSANCVQNTKLLKVRLGDDDESDESKQM